MGLFFFNETATTEIYTLSLHDALPICVGDVGGLDGAEEASALAGLDRQLHGASLELGLEVLGLLDRRELASGDRKSTRLNSSHANISYAVFCLKKKNRPGWRHSRLPQQ